MFKRIVHCDLKASNILVVNENWVEISDFGLAKSTNNTRRGHSIGTLTHAAIELLNTFGVVGINNCEATDVWSYGVLMWEIFDTTRERPYQKEVPTLNQILLLDFLMKDG
uniref:Protein kinase domain-containing protein n=1 Tax=Panagrolaimus sp. ES5 TaxID=591445 RepID=A0AC34GC38_9BILA